MSDICNICSLPEIPIPVEVLSPEAQAAIKVIATLDLIGQSQEPHDRASMSIMVHPGTESYDLIVGILTHLPWKGHDQ